MESRQQASECADGKPTDYTKGDCKWRNGKRKRAVRLGDFTDYTGNQRTRAKGTDGSLKAIDNDFDFNKALHDMGAKGDPKAVAQQYLDWCKAKGYVPKFDQFAGDTNYYKLLEDFTLYDKDGKYVPQREVRAVFPKAGNAFGDMKGLIEQGLEEDAIIDGRRTENVGKIVDEIEQNLPRTEAEIPEAEVQQAEGDVESLRQYSIKAGAPAEIHKAVTDKNYGGDIQLTDVSPSVMLGHKGVKNLPMLMKASHIRENILTEEEARELGIKIKDDINYHGLGEELFKKVIDSLDEITVAYRGTPKADDPSRRENSFLLLSTIKDNNGDTIVVPVYINETGSYNRVFIKTNKIASVYGKTNLNEYIQREIRKGNLVRIKKRGPASSESPAPIAVDYAGVTSAEEAADQTAMASYNSIIPQSESKSNTEFTQNSLKRGATMTESRIDDLIADSGAGRRTDYAQKWITSINPTDFLNMTLGKANQDRARFDTMPGDYDTTVNDYDFIEGGLKKSRQTPYLAIDINSGKVVGHEGRHRMRALEKEGITRAEIVIEFRDENGRTVKEMNGYGKALETIKTLAIHNQNGTGQSTAIQNIIPLNKANRENILNSYGPANKGDIQYSLKRESMSDLEVLELAAKSLPTDKMPEGRKKALEDFRTKLDKLRDLQKRRAELGKQYKEEMFTKGGDREKAKLTHAKMESLDRKIDSATNTLLVMRNKPVFRQILSEARKIIAKEERTKGQEALKAYRARRNESDAKRKYRERVENRAKEILKWLTSPDTKDARKRVPVAMQESLRDLLTSIDFSSKRALEGKAPTIKDRDFYRKMRAMQEAVAANIKAVGAESGYADIRPEFLEEFEALVKRVDELSEGEGYVINRMSGEELNELSKLLKEVQHYIAKANATVNNSAFSHASEMGDDTIRELGKMGEAGQGNLVERFFTWQNMRPAYVFSRFGKAGESIFEEFRVAQGKQARLTKEVEDFVASVFTPEQAKRFANISKTFRIGMNALYSDLCKVNAKFGIAGEHKDYWLEAACAYWLDDEDAVEDKLTAYYNYVVK